MINLSNLLADSSQPAGSNGILMWIMLGIVVVFFVVTQIFSAKKNKARQQEREDHLKTIAVGDYVLTIGMIYGKVVAIDNEHSTIVLETGNEEFKGYVCVFMSAIHSFSKEAISLDPFGQVVSNENNTAEVFEDMKSEDESANAATENAENNQTDTAAAENAEAVSEDTASVQESSESNLNKD